MSRTSGRRGLLLVLLALVLLAAIVDLVRPDSFILGVWNRPTERETPVERAVEQLKRNRAVPLPRSNRVGERDTRSVIPATRTSTGV